MPDMRLHVRNDLPVIGLVPTAVQLLRDCPELDHEIARQVFGPSLPALFAP